MYVCIYIYRKKELIIICYIGYIILQGKNFNLNNILLTSNIRCYELLFIKKCANAMLAFALKREENFTENT